MDQLAQVTDLDYVKTNLSIFPKDIFYKTTAQPTLKLTDANSFYVYIKSSVASPDICLLETQSVYFTIHAILYPGLKEIIGYIFKPNVPDSFKFRSTLHSLTVTSLDTLDNSLELIYNTDSIQILGLPGCEIITTIGNLLGVNLDA